MSKEETLYKIWTHEAMNALEALINEEIKEQPQNEDFLNGIRSSAFFRSLFKRGFTAGMYYQMKNKDTVYVMSEVNSTGETN